MTQEDYLQNQVSLNKKNFQEFNDEALYLYNHYYDTEQGILIKEDNSYEEYQATQNINFLSPNLEN